MKYLTVKIEIDSPSVAGEYAKAGDLLVALEVAKAKIVSATFDEDKKITLPGHPGPGYRPGIIGPVYGDGTGTIRNVGRNGPQADEV